LCSVVDPIRYHDERLGDFPLLLARRCNFLGILRAWALAVLFVTWLCKAGNDDSYSLLGQAGPNRHHHEFVLRKAPKTHEAHGQILSISLAIFILIVYPVCKSSTPR
jgi:hypothetical protein